eukprot:3195079-Pyramimonas_sp.AAC.1
MAAVWAMRTDQGACHLLAEGGPQGRQGRARGGHPALAVQEAGRPLARERRRGALAAGRAGYCQEVSVRC